MSSLNAVKKGSRLIAWSFIVTSCLAGSFFLIDGVLALLLGTDLFATEIVFLASICAVIAWMLMGFFLVTGETISLPVSQPATFLAKARRALLEMGYEIGKESTDCLTTKGSFHRLFVSRGFLIQLTDKQAQITGSKIWVDELRRRLRVHNFLSNPEIILPDISQQLPGVLLKRVTVQLRVPSAKLEEVRKHVLDVLAKEAEVVCDLSFLAKSDEGIRESTVESQIRRWLNTQGIPAEIQKDLTQMSEPPSSVLLPIRPKGTSAGHAGKRHVTQATSER